LAVKRHDRKICELELDVRLHDDGCAFICMGCGVVTQRTRMNPYPRIQHRTAQGKGE
jgi:hypothetical protein